MTGASKVRMRIMAERKSSISILGVCVDMCVRVRVRVCVRVCAKSRSGTQDVVSRLQALINKPHAHNRC